MNPLVAALIEQLRSADIESARDSVSIIATFLECKRGSGETTWPENQRLYAESLPRDLLDLDFPRSEHREVAEALGALALVSPLQPSIIWAIGKSPSEAGLPVLLNLMRADIFSSNRESAYQWAIALRDLMEKAWDMPDALEMAQLLLRSSGVDETLNSIARSSDERLASAIPSIRRTLKILLAQVGRLT